MRYLILSLLLTISTSRAQLVGPSNPILSGRIVRVIDGDTYVLQSTDRVRPSDVRQYMIRLLNVDAPELRQAFGTVARDSMSRYLRHQLVVATGPPPFFRLDTDIYGRVLAKITATTGPARGKRLDSLMLVRGWAWHNPAYGSVRRSGQTDAQGWTVTAQEVGAGLWHCNDACPPWLYRRFNARQKQINCPCHD
jgi:micrococcal nuclease